MSLPPPSPSEAMGSVYFPDPLERVGQAFVSARWAARSAREARGELAVAWQHRAWGCQVAILGLSVDQPKRTRLKIGTPNPLLTGDVSMYRLCLACLSLGFGWPSAL